MSEWKPCWKRPVQVEYREQDAGDETVSTREGLTPLRPDDLIIRGVQGECYPIGRDIFNATYTTEAPSRLALAERAVRAGIEAQDCDACGGTGYHTDYSSAPVETSVPEDYAERVPCEKCDPSDIAKRVIAEGE